MNNKAEVIMWLIRFRWIAIIFQLSAFFFGVNLGYINKKSLPFYLVVVASMAVLNCVSSKLKHVKLFSITFHVTVDLLSFTLLIYLAGGLHNPFWPLIYLHAGIGAILVSKKRSLFFAVVLGLCVLSIQYTSSSYHFAIFYTMLPQWIILFSFWFLTRAVGNLLKNQSNEIMELRERELNFQKIKSIGAISAGIIHELGTPLNTVRIKLDKIFDISNKDHLVMDSALSQCEETTAKVNSIQNESISSSVNDILKFISKYVEISSTDELEITLCSNCLDNLYCSYSIDNLRMIFEVLRNNAIEAGANKMTISLAKKQKRVHLLIEDDGPGFDEYILENFGSPYISTKGRGHGLGLFSSKMGIEAMGGSMNIKNTTNGSFVEIQLMESNV